MRSLTLAFILIFFPLTVQAGTEIKAKIQSYAYKEAWADLVFAIDQNKLRLDFKGPWTHGSLIYDRESSLVTAVDDLQKTTLALTPADQATLKLLGSLALTIAESQADKGNWNGRKTFEILRQNVRLLFNGTPQLQEKGVKTGGVACDKYVTYLDEGKAREVWAAPPEKTVMSTEDFNTFRSLAHLALDTAGGELTQLGAEPELFQKLFSEPQLPMLSVLTSQGKPAGRFEIAGLHAKVFPADLFTPPQGYQAVGLMDLLKPRPAAK